MAHVNLMVYGSSSGVKDIGDILKFISEITDACDEPNPSSKEKVFTFNQDDSLELIVQKISEHYGGKVTEPIFQIAATNIRRLILACISTTITFTKNGVLVQLPYENTGSALIQCGLLSSSLINDSTIADMTNLSSEPFSLCGDIKLEYLVSFLKSKWPQNLHPYVEEIARQLKKFSQARLNKNVALGPDVVTLKLSENLHDLVECGLCLEENYQASCKKKSTSDSETPGGPDENFDEQKDEFSLPTAEEKQEETERKLFAILAKKLKSSAGLKKGKIYWKYPMSFQMNTYLYLHGYKVTWDTVLEMVKIKWLHGPKYFQPPKTH